MKLTFNPWRVIINLLLLAGIGMIVGGVAWHDTALAVVVCGFVMSCMAICGMVLSGRN